MRSNKSEIADNAHKNGQAALDRSISVEESRQRVTTKNGKIVILRHEGNGVYHGYLVEDFHSIENKNIQQNISF